MSFEMEYTSVILERFRLPPQHVRALSSDRHLCLVSEDWVCRAVQGDIGGLSRALDGPVCDQLLAASLSSVPAPWRRVTIKTVPKSDRLVNSLSDGPLNKLNPKLSFTELMAHISRENFNNLWRAAHAKHTQAVHVSDKAKEQYSDVVRQWVNRLQPLSYYDLDNHDSDRNRPFTGQLDTTLMFNIVPIFALFETSQYFFILQPYLEHSLQDIVHFSPALFTSSHAKVLFVAYQILQTLRQLHDRGLPVGELRLRNLRADKKLWIYLSTPQFERLNSDSEYQNDNTLQQQNDHSNLSHDGTTIQDEQPVRNASSCSLFRNQSTVSSSSILSSQTENNSHMSKAALALSDARQFLNQNVCSMYKRTDLPKVIDDWVNRRLSNFQYLMILNYLAGRRMNDPNNHPVLPWIMDFTHPDGGYRDLSKSKYRLNKGDRQLDIMYESIPLLGVSTTEPTLTQTPHHISDILSDITYYVYKARITPKSILCAHVRTKWVPNEYPSSMQRLQDWTPDECIPEFFTDPTVFSTIHDDLPDLEVPPWCYSPRDFVEKHLAVLESDHVGCRLHQWIDLTFGYQLSSQAAVSSKNVYLHLADQHTDVTNHGVVQLFDEPHPYRSPVTVSLPSHPPIVIQNNLQQMWHGGEVEIAVFNEAETLEPFETKPSANQLQVPGDEVSGVEVETVKKRRPSSSGAELSPLPRPEHAPIRLPPEYDPMAALDHLESLYNFSMKTVQCLPSSAQKQTDSPVSQSAGRQSLVWSDMQALGCVLAELFYAPMLRMSSPCASLRDRYKLICKLYHDHPHTMPRPLRQAVSVLLQLDNGKTSDEASKLISELEQDSKGPLFMYDHVSKTGLPPPNPALLLNPCVDIFPFPSHYAELYDCLHAVQQKQFEIENVKLSSLIIIEKVKLIKVMARDKVMILEKFLFKFHTKLSEEELELVLPYVEELCEDSQTSVQAAWHLFNVVAKVVGPKEARKKFLKYLTTLMSGETSTPKHMKLYHRVFLMQIVIRLGLQTFLNNFSTLLVEAVAGYKDFDLAVDQDLTEEDLHDSQQSETDVEPSPNSFTDPDQTDSDSDLDNSASMVTASSQPEISAEADEDFPDNLSINGETGDEDRESLSQYDGVSEGSNQHGSCSSLSHEATGESDTDALKYGIGSVGKESIHSLSRLIDITRNNMDNTAGSDLDVSESQGDLYSVFDERPSFHLESDMSSDETKGTKKAAAEKKGLNGSKPRLSEIQTPSTDTDGSLRTPNTPALVLSPHMVRSETDEFRSVYSQQSGEQQQQQHSNICDVAAESIKWLSMRLGPLLTAKYLSRNLIRMLGLCYLGEEQLEAIPQQPAGAVPLASCQLVTGDRNVWKLLDCLGHVVVLYGERVVLSQFFPCIQDMISVSMKRMTVRAESGLIGVVVLLRYATQFLSDKTLMDILQDTLINEMLLPLIRLVSMSTVSFPSGPLPRTILCYKIVDIIYILGLRIGFEMTRKHMTVLLQKFFAAFDVVHEQPKTEGDTVSTLPPPISKVASQTSLYSLGSTDDYLNIKIDSETLECHIGTPVSVGYLSIPQSPTNTGSWKKLYSLSPAHDDREEPYETKIANKERIMLELTQVFSPELAFTSYIPLCRIFGSIHIEQHLKNDDLIRQLCTQHDQSIERQNNPTSPTSPSGSSANQPLGEVSENGLETSGEIGSNVAVVGNRIQLQSDLPSPTVGGYSQLGKSLRHSGILSVNPEKLRCTDMDHNVQRHLKGNWLAYWEHEIGLSERDTMFNFKQIKLQTFLGHSNSIRALCVMDNENSFVSASKDKTVRLWSLRSDGDGSAKSRCKWSYPYHKKSVFSVAFLETMRYMASCDSTVHIWDPFTAVVVSQLDSSRHSPVLALTPLPAPNPHLMTATTDGTLRFLDLRGPKYAHEYRCTSNSSGLIRCVDVSPNSDWVAVGYSTGLTSVLDLRTGLLMGAWKGHDGEILQIKAFNKHSFVTSSFDQTMKLWKVDDGKEICHLKGPTEPVHCFNFYNSQIISATTANKIGVHSSVDTSHQFTSTRLRGDTFKGVLTCMNVLPLNRALILGADSGAIRLLC